MIAARCSLIVVALCLCGTVSGCLATRSRLTTYENYDARGPEGDRVAEAPFPVPAPTPPPRLQPVPGDTLLPPPPVPAAEETSADGDFSTEPDLTSVPNRTISWSKPSTWFRGKHNSASAGK